MQGPGAKLAQNDTWGKTNYSEALDADPERHRETRRTLCEKCRPTEHLVEKAAALMEGGIGEVVFVARVLEVRNCPFPATLELKVVIRVKAVSEKEVDSGNDIYGNPIKRIQYEIKQIKMFKGPEKDIEFIYTAPSSAVCGVSLDVGGKKEYLIAGKAEGDGKMHITLCDFIVPWDTLSTTQKKSLNHRYQMGCECKITRCPMIPCYISSPDECLWMDWVTEKSINGHQAKFFACIKRSDGSCAWYRGAAPPKQEFLDIEDP
ncbi:Metalloproteinase inhibitor 2 [Fukomys damarensis]|uniref:Metalloproteinase inhibitor 2 n=2 Tax=Rodentia TaxID=9989 RepID=A0A091DZF5_FUKDA|nr:Metalloproteinase inhibitor 2 [Fukomys damarensis]